MSSTAPQRASPHNPLARFFEREMHIGSHLLNMVLADLNVLAQVLDGRIKQTNHIRALLSTLNRGKEFKFVCKQIANLKPDSNHSRSLEGVQDSTENDSYRVDLRSLRPACPA